MPRNTQRHKTEKKKNPFPPWTGFKALLQTQTGIAGIQHSSHKLSLRWGVQPWLRVIKGLIIYHGHLGISQACPLHTQRFLASWHFESSGHSLQAKTQRLSQDRTLTHQNFLEGIWVKLVCLEWPVPCNLSHSPSQCRGLGDKVMSGHSCTQWSQRSFPT